MRFPQYCKKSRRLSRKKKNFLFLRIGKGEKTLNIELINMKSQSDNNRIHNKEKRNRIIAAFFLLLCIFACVSPSEGQYIVVKYDSIDNPLPCKVIDIKKTTKRVNGTRDAYLICVEDTIREEYITFVSLKDKNDKVGEKIRKGQVYLFNVDFYYKNDRYLNFGFKKDIKIGDKVILVPEDRYSLYPATTPNLKGLRYIPSE